jgi:hypothetical protein
VHIDHAAVAGRLIAAYDGVTTLAPITAAQSDFSAEDG